MPLKSVINRLLKTKPPQFPKGSKFSKTEAKSLLEEAQSKVQDIESSTGKIKSQKDFGIVPDVEIPKNHEERTLQREIAAKYRTSPEACSIWFL